MDHAISQSRKISLAEQNPATIHKLDVEIDQSTVASISDTDPRNWQGAQPVDVWERELTSIQELSEIEPDSKWPLLALVHIYQHLDLAKYADAAIEALDRLVSIDALRQNYYLDLRSRFVLEQRLATMALQCDPSHLPFLVKPDLIVDLCDLGLTVIADTCQLAFARSIDLSRNRLVSASLGNQLSLLTSLVLDDNHLTSLDGIEHLVGLEKLSAKRNKLQNAQAAAAVKHLARLLLVELEGNPMSSEDMHLVAQWLPTASKIRN
eukprot:jgi/Hompol1/4825/HPOL_003971-RA